MTLKMETMSKNVVGIMKQLAKNNALVELLINNDSKLPLLRDSKGLDAKITTKIRENITNPFSETAKIFPYPFNVEATVSDGCFIRVYYNDGEFNENEVIADSQLHIDIVVARSQWLINDGVNSLIRAYEIMGRVIDLVGKRSVGSPIKIKFDGYQHLYVNDKFDAIRLYANYMSVES